MGPPKAPQVGLATCFDLLRPFEHIDHDHNQNSVNVLGGVTATR